jgi:hemerythrin
MTHSDRHLEWQHDFELGIRVIDDQHRYFVDLINRLSDELLVTQHADYQAALMSELKAYARFHFISEENQMLLAGYPALGEHRGHHHDLIDRLSARIVRFESSHTSETAAAVIDFLIEWFTHHTVHEDRRFSDWLAQTHPDQISG